MHILPLSAIEPAQGSPVETQRTAGGWRLAATAPFSAVVRAGTSARACRLAPATDRDVVQLGCGQTSSALCDSVYDPQTDTAFTFTGPGVHLDVAGRRLRVHCDGELDISVIPKYMAEHRGLPWYEPLRRKSFARPPAGWCSWYYYYLEITEEEVRSNVAWLAEHLAPFGCEWVLVDDGWQGKGGGWGTNRDWFKVCERDFPSGMAALAEDIRRHSLRPGIWCIPFTQSDPDRFASQPGLFLHRPDGSSAGELTELQGDDTWPLEERGVEWAGRYFVDPTSSEAPAYFSRLIDLLCNQWGYDYLKLDAMGMMSHFYRRYRDALHTSGPDAGDPVRRGLEAISAAVGPERFLLCCAQAYESVGLCQGIRTGSDVEPSWEGYQVGIDATLRSLFMNTLAFYTDPDVVCVREPLALEHARLWATFVALTGQITMASDQMYSLPEERVELLRRIFPVAGIHPMELYPLDVAQRPHIFDLKVAPARAEPWDVVALFNWDPHAPVDLALSPERLGLTPGRMLWLDGWSGDLLHAGEGEWCVSVPPADSRLLSCWRDLGRPQFVGTNRHVTQGAVDLTSVRWDARRQVLVGRSEVVGGHRYRVRVHVPDGYRVDSDCTRRGNIAELLIEQPASGPVDWRVHFSRA